MRAIAVPVHLDALVVDRAAGNVIGPLLNFAHMPFVAGGREINGDTPFLGSEIAGEPFETASFALGAGVHLHWTLPTPATRSAARGDASRTHSFAPAPNRWLVRRSGNPADEAAWLVQSDYLSGERNGVVVYPLVSEDEVKAGSLGRSLALDPRRPRPGMDGDPLPEPLTALGPGDPAFAAFYPNCHGVFGFHDKDPLDGPVRYEIMGWYESAGLDPIPGVVKDIVAATKGGGETETIVKALERRFDWIIEDRNVLPERMICYASLTLDGSATAGDSAGVANVAVANSGGEALAALLAQAATPDQALEEQLEALRLASGLHGHRLDFARKFREARHESGFKALSGDTEWCLRIRRGTRKSAAGEEGLIDILDLPSAIAEQLHGLNTAQQELEQCADALATMRSQMFSDWIKYMICAYRVPGDRTAYPEIDDVLAYLDDVAMPTLEEQKQRHVALAQNVDGAKTVLARSLAEWSPTSGATAELISRPGQRFYEPAEPVVLLRGEDTKATDRLNGSAPVRCRLVEFPDDNKLDQESAGDVLLPVLDRLHRHSGGAGQWASDGRPWHPLFLEWQVELLPAGNGSNLDAPDWSYTAGFVESNFGFAADAAADSAEADGISDDDEDEPDDEAEGPDDDVDLHPAKGSAVIQASCVFAGRSILSGHAAPRLRHDLERFFAARMPQAVQKAAADALNAPADTQPRRAWIGANWGGIARWYLDGGSGLAKRATATGSVSKFCDAELKAVAALYGDDCRLILKDVSAKAVKELRADYLASTGDQLPDGEPLDADQARRFVQWYRRELHLIHFLAIYRDHADELDDALSQALSGFNEALLQHRQMYHLPVDEPLGFADSRAVTRLLGAAVGDAFRSMPQPHNNFMPIRAGAMRVSRLRLVDSFGQTREVPTEGKIVYPAAWHRDTRGFVTLPPRLVQPAMLDMRWLAATHETATHASDAPGTGPICGWLMANDLDDSIAVFAADGSARGSLVSSDGTVEKAPPPGSMAFLDDNGHDAADAIVDRLVRGADPIGDRPPAKGLISHLSESFGKIEPENFEQHHATALLFGRPLALVRVNLRLRLKGLPAVDQSWPAFEEDLAERRPLERRHNAGIAAVRFPVKLGDHAQFGDGVCGYWMDDENGKPGPFVPCARDEQRAFLRIGDTQGLTFTLLMDPRAKVHATTGILPVKVLQIPGRHYAEALKRIEVSFPVTPLLAGRAQISVPLPDEAGYAWSWIERREDGMHETGVEGHISEGWFRAAPEIAATGQGEALWRAMLDGLWVTKADGPGGVMTVTPGNRRDPNRPLAEVLKSYRAVVEKVLMRTRLVQPEIIGPFQDETVIREGWLTLRPLPQSRSATATTVP